MLTYSDAVLIAQTAFYIVLNICHFLFINYTICYNASFKFDALTGIFNRYEHNDVNQWSYFLNVFQICFLLFI